MKRPATSESLGIFWHGDEVDGFLIYGYWEGAHQDEPGFSVADWPPKTEFKSHKLWGPGWTVWMWNVRVPVWPAAREWPGLVERMLRELVEQGALIAWGGIEGMFVDPPSLLDPAEMSGGVWAAMTKDVGMVGPPGLHQPFDVLDDSHLVRFHELITAPKDR